MRNRIAETIFWSHAVIVIFWWGLLLVPTSVWTNKISFHFYLSTSIVVHQFIWGAFILPWTKHYRPICILTTIMQWIRGKRLSNELNYQHVWTKEFFQRIGWGLPQRGATIITAVVFTIVNIQYFFFR